MNFYEGVRLGNILYPVSCISYLQRNTSFADEGQWAFSELYKSLMADFTLAANNGYKDSAVLSSFVCGKGFSTGIHRNSTDLYTDCLPRGILKEQKKCNSFVIWRKKRKNGGNRIQNPPFAPSCPVFLFRPILYLSYLFFSYLYYTILLYPNLT